MIDMTDMTDMPETADDGLTLALWQTPFAADPAEALQRLDGAAAQARAAGADLLLCPEMGLCGYAIGAAAVRERAEPVDGPLAQAVATLARRHGLALVVGLAERHPDGQRPYNTALAFGPDGTRLARYRKVHLFGDMDRAQFSAGDAGSRVWSWRGWRFGLLICFDVEFPQTVQQLARQGVDVVLVPTANMREYDEVPMQMVPTRARDNAVWVAYANACGDEGGLHDGRLNYGGLSTVARPDGAVAMCAGRGPELRVIRLSRPGGR